MRTDLINGLATVGQRLYMVDDTLPIKVIANYVSICADAFELTADEIKALLYLIVRMK